MKRFKLYTVITFIVSVSTGIGLLILFLVATGTISGIIDGMASESVRTTLDAQTVLIEQYISNAETQLIEFSCSPIVREFLEDPGSREKQERAQAYLDEYYKELGWEGLYIADWTSTQLAHITRSAVGKAFRTDPEALRQWQDSMLQSGNGLVNQGVFVSPSTGAILLNMRMLITDAAGNPIGAVGGGPYIDELGETMRKIEMYGLKSAAFCIVDTDSMLYVIGSDESIVRQPVEDEIHLRILDKAKAGENSGSVTQNGMMVEYEFIPQHHVLLMISDTVSDIHTMSDRMRGSFGSLVCIVFAVMVIVTFIISRIVIIPLRRVEAAVNDLNDLSLKKNHLITPLLGGRSETSRMADAVDHLVDTWAGIVSTIQTSMKTIGDGSDNMENAAESLMESAAENAAIAEELSSSIADTNSAIDSVTTEISVITKLISDVNNKTKESCSKSDTLTDSILAMSNSAEETVDATDKRIAKTRQEIEDVLVSLNALLEIRSMVDSILDIAEQTNLLSLNASIEAARAGETGKGFAVVAEEIGKLAALSSETANEIQKICDETTASVGEIKACFGSIINFMENDVARNFRNFAEISQECSENVGEVRESIESITAAATGVVSAANNIIEQVNVVQQSSKENEQGIEQIVEKVDITNDVAKKMGELIADNRKSVVDVENLTGRFRR